MRICLVVTIWFWVREAGKSASSAKAEHDAAVGVVCVVATWGALWAVRPCRLQPLLINTAALPLDPMPRAPHTYTHALSAPLPPTLYAAPSWVRWIGSHVASVRKLMRGDASNGTNGTINTLQTLEEDTELSREQFKKLLETIDAGLRALPATAQVSMGGVCLGGWLSRCVCMCGCV